jgi:7-carboxy-7-deazaguanine synthase
MNAKQIIPSDFHKHRKVFQKDGDNFLNISEFYFDTIQGEGVWTGYPATFLRLQGCTLNCSYCDTTEVWRYGSPYTFIELFDLMSDKNIVEQLRKGQHLVITGGSPLLQQDHFYDFIFAFFKRFNFKPFIEIENECVIMPQATLVGIVDCWNNSPKLTSSNISFEKRYKPEVINYMSQLDNSWFKFVISSPDEWNEIDTIFLLPAIIKRNQIILMPEGMTEDEIKLKREIVIETAIENHVRYCTREHIMVWGRRTGI